MNKYLKMFLLSLLFCIVTVGTIALMYMRYLEKKIDIVEITPSITLSTEVGVEKAPVDITKLNRLEDIVRVSKRLNVLFLGTDGGRADTVMLASYDPEHKLLDLVVIPRDTYHEVPGYDGFEQHKINAVYGYGKKDGGSEGMRGQVSLLLKVPIHYYVTLNYDGVADIVDVLGGVQITVEHNMKYDDPTADPPLHIDISKGIHILNGKQAVEYLRWRKNNGEEGSDLDRTDRQIGFVKAVINQTLSKFKLPQVIEKTFNYVYTSMPLDEMLYNTTTLVGFNPKSAIESYRLPGVVKYNKLSYYVHNVQETEDMMIKIYKRGYVPLQEDSSENIED